jgi:hypothetical protein
MEILARDPSNVNPYVKSQNHLPIRNYTHLCSDRGALNAHSDVYVKGSLGPAPCIASLHAVHYRL